MEINTQNPDEQLNDPANQENYPKTEGNQSAQDDKELDNGTNPDESDDVHDASMDNTNDFDDTNDTDDLDDTGDVNDTDELEDTDDLDYTEDLDDTDEPANDKDGNDGFPDEQADTEGQR